MNERQAPARTEITPEMEAQAAAQKALNQQQQMLVDYRALNGLCYDGSFDERGELRLRKITFTELAQMIGVNRNTLYDWQNNIPMFWQRVNDRRAELAPQSRLAKVHETWFLKAAKGDFQHMQLWLANFDPNFRMPTEKVEHEVGNSWAKLLENNRSKYKTVDAEIVPDADANV